QALDVPVRGRSAGPDPALLDVELAEGARQLARAELGAVVGDHRLQVPARLRELRGDALDERRAVPSGGLARRGVELPPGEAVALYVRTDRTLGELAHDLGVSRESLRLWVQQAKIESGEREGITGDEREELRALRRRVLLLEQEREILKKAAAFFAKESET